MKITDLKINQIINNHTLQSIFSCGNMGGMRASKKTNTLVLISDYTKSLYEDRWIDDLLHYTGMGKVGDQALNRQNKTLFYSNDSDIVIHLFEVFLPNQYTYRGTVHLAEKPYQEVQKDENQNSRKVWMFPLALDNTNTLLDDKIIKANINYKRQSIKRMDLDTLRTKAIQTEVLIPSRRKVITNRYTGSEYIAEYAKRIAHGICQLCNQKAPFLMTDGQPYLESYHIQQLSQGGSDAIHNVIALCPNCRAKMQILNLDSDVKYLKEKAIKQFETLI